MSRVVKNIDSIRAVERGEIVIKPDRTISGAGPNRQMAPVVPSNGANRIVLPEVRSLFDIPRPPAYDLDELLRNRYICRGGGLLLCGLTGIGKSTWTIQAAIKWALGLPHCGIEPTRPLKSLIFQSENDDGDLFEMCDGVCAGLNLTQEQIESVKQMVMIVREDQRTSFTFINQVLRPILEQEKPDLVWIDHALAYLGGDASNQAEVSKFLRNGLNPLLREFRCGCVVVAHGNKPPTGKEKGGWQAGDHAYAATGSIEWANWARAVLVIRSIGSYTEFELIAGKRGGRLGWTDDANETVYTKFIRQDKRPGVIFWSEIAGEDLISSGRPKQYTGDELLTVLPPEGLTTTEWFDEAKREFGISERNFYLLKKQLVDKEQLVQDAISKKWQPYDETLQ